MDRSSHTLACLFAQLGIDNQESDIEQFIQSHRGIPPEVPLAKASFWSDAQAEFLKEGLQEDSDWAEVIDCLDALLR